MKHDSDTDHLNSEAATQLASTLERDRRNRLPPAPEPIDMEKRNAAPVATLPAASMALVCVGVVGFGLGVLAKQLLWR